MNSLILLLKGKGNGIKGKNVGLIWHCEGKEFLMWHFIGCKR
jgi:hypothetical protein